MLPPLQTMATFRPANRSGLLRTAARAAAPGGLGEVAGLLDHQPRRGLQRVLGDQDEVIQLVPQDLLRQLERGPGGQSLGERGVLGFDQAACAPGAVRGRGRLRLHGDHLDRRADGLGHHAGPGRPAAAADRDHDHVGVRLGLEDLQGVGGHARDELRLIPRVDVPVAVLGGLLLAVLAGLVEVAAREDHLGAQRLHRLHLDRVGLLGHADHGPHAEQVSRVRDRLAVIAGRGGDDAPVPFGRGELAEQVHAAADLERAHRQVILVLDPHPGGGQRVQRGIAVQRGGLEVGRDALAGGQHVGQVGHWPAGGHVSCLPRRGGGPGAAGQPEGDRTSHSSTPPTCRAGCPVSSSKARRSWSWCSASGVRTTIAVSQ